jgi:hypothetical protein
MRYAFRFLGPLGLCLAIVRKGQVLATLNSAEINSQVDQVKQGLGKGERVPQECA